MKKMFAVMTALMLLSACLVPAALGAGNERLTVVTTIFPIYDWVREIAAGCEGIAVTMLLDKGVDLHSFQPTAQDIMKVSACDLFVYVGGESDEWVEDALKSRINEEMITVDLVEAMGEDIKIEETVEGMEHDHGHDHEEEEEDHDHDHEEEEEDHDHGEETHDHEHGEEADEHVWLSLRNAHRLVKAISEAMAAADPADAQAFRANADAYIAKLDALDQDYAAMVEGARLRTVLFGDRFPFRYLTDDYGLSYYAAFSGCSAESEASFETIIFLAQKLDELELPAVLTIENNRTRIAQTIVASSKDTGRKILSMDSMQGTTMEDVKNGVTYLSVMESNLEVLKEALN